jgi:hypothetical protein
MRNVLRWSVCAGISGLLSGSAVGGSHSWRVNELYSNATGTIQFIELKECCGLSQEIFVVAEEVTSNTSTFMFPGNLIGPTSNKTLLLATDGFAALPGAPARDYAISANFFSINGDTIRYNPQGNYDTFSFDSGVLPTDGVNSIQITNFNTHTFVTGPNTPTNYAGQTGSISGNIPAVSEWGVVLIALSILVAGSLLIRQRSQTQP